MAVQYTGLFGHGTLKDTARHVAKTNGAKAAKSGDKPVRKAGGTTPVSRRSGK